MTGGNSGIFPTDPNPAASQARRARATSPRSAAAEVRSRPRSSSASRAGSTDNSLLNKWATQSLADFVSNTIGGNGNNNEGRRPANSNYRYASNREFSSPSTFMRLNISGDYNNSSLRSDNVNLRRASPYAPRGAPSPITGM